MMTRIRAPCPSRDVCVQTEASSFLLESCLGDLHTRSPGDNKGSPRGDNTRISPASLPSLNSEPLVSLSTCSSLPPLEEEAKEGHQGEMPKNGETNREKAYRRLLSRRSPLKCLSDSEVHFRTVTPQGARGSLARLPVARVKEGDGTTVRPVTALRRAQSIAEFNNVRRNYNHYSHYRMSHGRPRQFPLLLRPTLPGATPITPGPAPAPGTTPLVLRATGHGGERVAGREVAPDDSRKPRIGALVSSCAQYSMDSLDVSDPRMELRGSSWAGLTGRDKPAAGGGDKDKDRGGNGGGDRLVERDVDKGRGTDNAVDKAGGEDGGGDGDHNNHNHRERNLNVKENCDPPAKHVPTPTKSYPSPTSALRPAPRQPASRLPVPRSGSHSFAHPLTFSRSPMRHFNDADTFDSFSREEFFICNSQPKRALAGHVAANAQWGVRDNRAASPKRDCDVTAHDKKNNKANVAPVSSNRLTLTQENLQMFEVIGGDDERLLEEAGQGAANGGTQSPPVSKRVINWVKEMHIDLPSAAKRPPSVIREDVVDGLSEVTTTLSDVRL